MAKYLPLPKSLQEADKNFIKDLIEATEWQFAGDLLGEVNRSLREPYTTSDGFYNWSSGKELLEYTLNLTNTNDIKSASNVLYQNITKAPEYTEPTISATTPNKEVISKEQIAKNDEAIAQRKIDTERSNQEVRNAIAQKQKLYAEQIQKAKELETKLKGQKIYYKVEESPSDLKQQTEANPKQFVNDTVKEFEKNPILKDLSPEEVQLTSKQAALTTYETFRGNSPMVQAEIIKKIISDSQNQDLKDIGSILIDQKIAQYELAEQFVNLPENINVEFSDIPKEGFKEFDFSQIPQEHIQNLNSQNNLLENISSLGEGEIKSQFLLNIGTRIESHIATLPANSLLAKTYNSEVVQFGLQSFGVVRATPWVAVNGSFVGKLAVDSGLGSVAGFIQNTTGIGLGVYVAASAAATTATATSIATTGGIMASEAFLGGAAAAAAPVTGGASLVVGAVADFVTNIVGPKVISKIKDFISENGPILVGGMVAILGGFLGAGSIGFGLGSVLGFGAGYGGATLIAGGTAALGASISATTSAIGAGISFIFQTALAGIGMPILITFLAFPVIVALILFIINSGAYVVPPSFSSLTSQNQYIDVTKTASPAGPFQNTDLPLKITYTITISAKREVLTNVIVKDECSVITKAGSQNCTAPPIVVPGGSIGVGSPFVFSYDANYNSTYKDALVINTVTVTANLANEGSQQTAIGSASVIIGNPPEGCPSRSLWPTNSGVITQGAYTTSSHRTLEAIDIGVSNVGVMTTHSGVVVHAQSDSCYGNNIEIQSTCGGKEFVSRYAHLEGIKVKTGQSVTMGQQIGLSGNTTGGKPSCSTGAHLHYGFYYWPNLISTKYPDNPPFMMMPYLPQDVKRGCVDNCFVSW